MDYFEGVVRDYLRADPALFVGVFGIGGGLMEPYQVLQKHAQSLAAMRTTIFRR